MLSFSLFACSPFFIVRGSFSSEHPEPLAPGRYLTSYGQGFGQLKFYPGH